MRSICAAAAGLFAAGCLSGAAWSLNVRDDLRHQVTLSAPAQRIVTLSPHATDLVLAAGAGSQLVGIAAGGDSIDQLASLPRIGGPGGLDRERLLTLRPDLVIAWHSGNRPSDLAWIRHRGTALFLSEPRSLDDIAATIEAIGELAGRTAQATAAAARFRQQTNGTCARGPLRVAYVEVWATPAMSVGGRHWINAVLRAAGYLNVLEHLDLGAFAIAKEVAHGFRDLPTIRLIRSFDGGDDDHLAGLLSRPGPLLGEAVARLCERRRNGDKNLSEGVTPNQ